MVDRPFIGKWISCLYRTGQSFCDQRVAEHGITNGGFPYMMYLCQQEGVTQDAMSRYFNMDKATTARAISRLESSGLVERQIDSSDRRANKVYLTEKGRAMEPVLRGILEEWAAMMSVGLTAEERETVYNLVERMARNAIAYREKQSL